MIFQKYKTKGLLFLFSLILTNLSAQSLPDSLIKKIDGLFIQWNNANIPGCAIGIVRNDSLLYAKGYGLANLEYGIPFTPQTIFDICSISKQFTGYCIVLLAKQGKLQLDDDVHKYLPWFLPNSKEKITVRNLLNHTSGIRDFFELADIQGAQRDDVHSSESSLTLLRKQQGLNFKPGSEFSYSNSNYLLLAEIVKAISGQSLRKFADSAIFKPLEMRNTSFSDDHTEVIKNRASPYVRIDSVHFVKGIANYAVPGPSSLLTNVEDIAKWVMNFYNTKVGDKKDIDLLTAKGKLNSGIELEYASGIFSDTYKGWKQLEHGGVLPGFRSFLIVIPDVRMGFIVFSNNSDVDEWLKVHQMANLFLTDTAKTNTARISQVIDSSKAILPSIISIQKFIGDYISDEGIQLNIISSNKKLYANIYGQSNLLLKKNVNTFSYFNDSVVKFSFTTRGKDSFIVGMFPRDDQILHFKKYVRIKTPTDNLLRTYAGTYYCPELDTKYSIVFKNHSLVLTNKNGLHRELDFLGNDHLGNYHLINPWEGMQHLLIIRDSENRIIGFEGNSGRVKHLKFNKIE